MMLAGVIDPNYQGEIKLLLTIRKNMSGIQKIP